ncbi:unnamed protein product [Dovyalis caffra]|uniref:Maturase K n=1 Tax=Dovyalis caffra TaxID=77055 RepID=A0AAV1QM27_9ROSI|nr:unnamed protein product [Dovyalis caffra]
MTPGLALLLVRACVDVHSNVQLQHWPLNSLNSVREIVLQDSFNFPWLQKLKVPIETKSRGQLIKELIQLLTPQFLPLDQPFRNFPLTLLSR